MKKTFALALIPILICTSCSSSPVDLSNRMITLEVNGCSLQMPLGKNNVYYDVPTLNCEFNTDIKLIENMSCDISIDGVSIKKDETQSFLLDRLSADKNIEISVVSGSESKTLFIRTYASFLPEMTSEGASLYEGDYYLSFMRGASAIAKLSKEGKLLYYYGRDEVAKDGDGLYIDFKKHTYSSGQVRYSYHESRPDLFSDFNLADYEPGERVVLDDHYREVKRIRRVGSTDRCGENDAPLDGHDFILLNDNHWISSSYVNLLVDDVPEDLSPKSDGVSLITSYVQEVQNGNVVFEYCASNNPELYRLTDSSHADYANAESIYPDVFHLNSMAIDPEDENIVLSYEYLSTMIKVNRDTKQIVWKLSGAQDDFDMTSSQKTSFQNYVRITEDGYLTIFNNGCGYSTPKTSIIKMRINEDTMRVEMYKSYSSAGHYSSRGGSAQLLDNIKDVFCIGWGDNSSDAITYAVSEIDFSKTAPATSFAIAIPKKFSTYRVQKFA